MSARNQLWLIDWKNPLTDHVGLGFFQALPQCPGVYYLHDRQNKILYIGQSGNLRKRLNSYRYIHLDSHPKRLVRLVSLTKSIEFEKAGSPMEAEVVENARIATHKPPFNKAKIFPEGYVYLLFHLTGSSDPMGSWCVDLSCETDFHSSTSAGPPPLVFGAFKSRRSVIAVCRSLARLLSLTECHQSSSSTPGDYRNLPSEYLDAPGRRQTFLPLIPASSPLTPHPDQLLEYILAYFNGSDSRLLNVFQDAFAISDTEVELMESEQYQPMHFWKRWLLDDFYRLLQFFHSVLAKNFIGRELDGIRQSFIPAHQINDVLTRINWKFKGSQNH